MNTEKFECVYCGCLVRWGFNEGKEVLLDRFDKHSCKFKIEDKGGEDDGKNM